MALRNIVDVQITRQTAALTRVGFGTLAFVYNAISAPAVRVRAFSSAEEVDASTLPDEAKEALNAAFSGDLRPPAVKAIYRLQGQVVPDDDESYIDALIAAAEDDEDWYCVTIQSRASSDILSVAGWIESRDKIFVAASSDPAIIDPLNDEDVASALNAMSYARTGIIYSKSAATTWPDTAWAGPILPFDPGSVTWAFKRVSGVPGEYFTAEAISALEAKRATRLETILGLTRTIGGFTSDPGAYLDLIQGLDWLKQRLAEDIYFQLVNSAKIPYTNQGIAIIEGVVWARLQDAVARNVLADDEFLTVTTPDVAETDPNDRANRILRDVNFTARLSGAIHHVIVRGTASI